VKLSRKDIAEMEVLTDAAMTTTFGYLYIGCSLASPGEYDLTVHLRRRCGFMSNYFDHLWLLFAI